MMQTISIGNLVGGFRIVREIGRGGMATVYEAVEESLGRAVALKMPLAGGDGAVLERFRREGRVVNTLKELREGLWRRPWLCSCACRG